MDLNFQFNSVSAAFILRLFSYALLNAIGLYIESLAYATYSLIIYVNRTLNSLIRNLSL